MVVIAVMIVFAAVFTVAVVAVMNTSNPGIPPNNGGYYGDNDSVYGPPQPADSGDSIDDLYNDWLGE